MVKKTAVHASIAVSAALALASQAWAGPDKNAVAEDDSAAFQSDLERIAAERGVPEASATVTTRDGVTSAVAGLSAMKMLVVRQNEDGTLSYGHAATDAEVDAFVASGPVKAAEE